MKRIVLCFDGTWNEPADESLPQASQVETNVRRFYESVADRGPDGTPQEKWYNAGVGTQEWDKFVGGTFGAGLDLHILAGYRHLVGTYDDGDEIYVVGFSRGAYTARSLVGMLRNCGLVRRASGPLAALHGALAETRIGTAYGIYRTRDDGPDSAAARAFRSSPWARPVRVKFLGVWDTVGALGIPPNLLEQLDALNQRFYQFHDTRLSEIVEHAYHAIALDEHRFDYDVCMWDPKEAPSAQTVEQRWFAGAHSDVGGGYADRRLSDLALRWMQEKAAALGLGLTPVVLGPANYLGDLTDSYGAFLGGKYALARPAFFRRVLCTRFGNECVDDSVDRRRRDPTLGYRPPNAGLAPLAAETTAVAGVSSLNTGSARGGSA